MPGFPDLPLVPRPLAPQRVVVTGQPGDALDTFVRRTAEVLDVPLVPLAELTGAEEVAQLAAFDGWVTTGTYDARCAALLQRAQLLVHHDVPEPTTLTGLVRRTLKRVRAENVAPEQDWLAAVPAARPEPPELPIVRLQRPVDVEDWLRSLA